MVLPVTCAHCGWVFSPRINGRKYCSLRCASAHRWRLTLAERFEPYVDRSAGPTGCWPWLGHRVTSGYGRLVFRRQNLGAHRIAWELYDGSSPGELDVLHRCDNPPCCNPRHLFLGTHRDNMVDKVAKGRSNAPVGARNAGAKLTDEAVTLIRAEAAAGVRVKALAASFGVTPECIQNVIARRTWRHVG
jgi:hypothetical protein